MIIIRLFNNKAVARPLFFLLPLFVKKITIYQAVNKIPGWSVITDHLFNKNVFVRITYEIINYHLFIYINHLVSYNLPLV